MKRENIALSICVCVFLSHSPTHPLIHQTGTDDDSSREEVCDLDILPRRQCRWSEWPANVSTLRKDYEAEAKRKSGINLNYFHSDSAQTPLQVLCAVGDEKAVEWLLRAGAIADIDSENLRIKLSAAQYCARLYVTRNFTVDLKNI